MELIYCAGGNPRFAKIATSYGFRYGSRLPGYKTYAPVWFADQDWKQPDRAGYMRSLAEHRPTMATVIDLERLEQLPEVLSWSDEASQWADNILIIPKAIDCIRRLPRTVGGKRVILAYSVPTRYGGTSLPVWEFSGWPIHLLGGSPNSQISAYKHLAAIAEVVSLDGNYYQMKATKFCEHWQFGKWVADGRRTKFDATYAAFERSVRNIAVYWHERI